jgi:hypothetical protein
VEKLGRRAIVSIGVAAGVAGIAGSAAQKPPMRVPSDSWELNAFAREYNRYVEKLRAGELDLKEWDKVVHAWEKLVR